MNHKYEPTPEEEAKDSALADMLIAGNARWTARAEADGEGLAEKAMLTARALAVPDGLSDMDLDTVMLIGHQSISAIEALVARNPMALFDPDQWVGAIHVAILAGIQYGRIVPATQDTQQ